MRRGVIRFLPVDVVGVGAGAVEAAGPPPCCVGRLPCEAEAELEECWGVLGGGGCALAVQSEAWVWVWVWV